jgi:hypothetical protein
MRGGSQGQLMLGEDDNLYVVKFQNNPQATRVLANEFLATKLASAVGLSVPECDVIEVTPWLVKTTPELCITLAHTTEACRPGLQFGSKFVGGLMPGQVVDYLPEPLLLDVKNLNEFAGMLVLDKWACNVNGRQAVFLKKGRDRRYSAVFVDQGYCFNAGEWIFQDVVLRGVFPRNAVYERVGGWDSFEPWLSRVETMDEALICELAEAVPPEWYGGDVSEMERMIESLLARRVRVRELIEGFRDSDRQPFPNWGNGKGEPRDSAYGTATGMMQKRLQ